MTATSFAAPQDSAQLLASGHISLMHGWVPIGFQLVTAIVLALAVGWRSRRWRLVRLPVAAAVGGAVVYATHWYIVDRGLSDEPAPPALWVWIALTGMAAAVLVLGWREARHWRRGATVLAVPLCLLCAVLALNLWVGYFPTVQAAWNQLTSGPLPDQTDQATIARLFGGNADAWAAFDPTTVITRHGHYTGISGWFAISSQGAPSRREIAIADTAAMRVAGRDAAANPNNQTAAANALCALGRANGIDCAVVPQPGKHDWPFADQAFAAALPWLAGQLGTAGVPRIPLPGTSPPSAPEHATQVVPAGR